MKKTGAIHQALLAWYAREQRDLPWRRSKDPYRIWISEIMLQQTRVEAVLPYYARFLSNFPTVAALAAAEPDRLMNLWTGLGYYSRARNLQAAAQAIQADFGGKLPEGLEDLRSLKGIGPYTAAAISSIAFGRPHIAIDGNLERVLARLLALREDPKAAGREALAAFGAELVALGQPGELNQALMDLSALLCKPRSPDCGRCPAMDFCEARRLGIQEELPKKKKKAPPLELEALGWAVVSEGHLLLARRAPGEWLSGLWDLPWRILERGEAAATPPFGEFVAACNSIRTITKHKIDFEVKALRCKQRPGAAELSKLRAPASEFRWVPLEDLHGVHLPRPSEKALDALGIF